jgi:hypothetical protein
MYLLTATGSLFKAISNYSIALPALQNSNIVKLLWDFEPNEFTQGA